MSKSKILDLIPESLRPSLIEEVKEFMEEEQKKSKEKPEMTKKEIEESIIEWAKQAQSKNKK